MNKHDRSETICTSPATDDKATERERRRVDRSEELERHLQEAIDMATD